MTTEIEKLRNQWAKKLKELLAQRKNIDRQIVGLQQMLRGAAVLTEDPIPSEYTLDPLPLPPGLQEIRGLGLTEAVRLVLERTGHPMSAKQIRDRLESYDYPLTQANPMAAVHQVIKRLLKQGEIRPVEAVGKPCYEWVNPVEKALSVSALESMYGLTPGRTVPLSSLVRAGKRPLPSRKKIGTKPSVARQ